MSGLVRRAAIYTAGGLLSQGLLFLLWLLLPWLLPATEIGRFALAMFAVELLSALATLGMDAALVRYAGKGPQRLPRLLAAYFNAGGAYALVSLGVLLAVLVGWMESNNTLNWVADHLVLVLLAVLANVLWNLFQSSQIAAMQARRYALNQLVRSLLQLIVAVALATTVAATAGAIVAATAVASGTLLLRALPRGEWPVGAKARQALAEGDTLRRYGVPLMLYGVLGIVVTYTQRLLVDHYADLAVLGVFAYFNGLILQINGLWGAMNKAWAPEYFSLVDRDRSGALALLRGMLALLLMAYPALLALFVTAAELFLNELLLPAAYQERVDLFYMMLLAPLFTGLYSVAYPLYYHEPRTGRILAISGFLAVVNLTLGVALIGIWGAEGAALSFLMLAMLTTLVYLTVYPDWRCGRLGLAMTLAALLSLIACALLLVSAASWMFVLLMCLCALLMVALCQGEGAPLVRHLLRSFSSSSTRQTG